MPHFKKCIFVEDLLAITIYSCVAVIFVLIPPFNGSFLRIPIVLPVFIFIPGYAFIAALFPGKKEISEMERLTLSFAFSLVLTAFDGYLISLFPWGYHPAPIVISTLGMTTFFCFTAIFTRKLLDESKQFSFSIKEFIRSVESDEIDESNKVSKRTPSFVRKGILHRFPDLEIEKMFIAGLIISLILIGGVQVYAKLTQEKENFTALYILGPEGKAEGYPTESLINVPLNVTVGIENHEHQDINYVLQMKADDEVIKEMNISIKDGGTWQKNVTYKRQKFKVGKSGLEFALFKDHPGSSPYRSVHIYIENNNTLAQVKNLEYTEVPLIKNGNMESSTGWKFTSNTNNITGSYVNGSGVDSSYAYRVANTYAGNLTKLPEYGLISQDIECKEKTTVILSAYVRSVSNSTAQGTNYQVKQITVNKETVWKEGINGIGDWQHLVIPIDLQAGSNNLTFGLRQTPGEISPVEVFWDSISLKHLTDINNITETGIVESISPISSVQKLPNYVTTNTFNVSWSGTDNDSGIAYYSIDSSTDGINWKNWIPKTTDNSSVFTGENNVTYYFRSKAVDNAGNEEPVHQKADAQTKVFSGIPQLTLDITPNPCKTATTFTVTYPLPLKAAVCSVTPDGFESEAAELKSIDSVTWTGSYIVKHGKHFTVEAICTDMNGNPSSVFDEFTVDNSMPDLLIEISPETIDAGDLEIKVTPSTALNSKPSVSISANETVSANYVSYSDGTYFYKAKIDRDVNEGQHEVSVTGYGLDSKEVTGSSTFMVSHSS